MSDSCVLPQFDRDRAARLAAELFALEGPIKPLDGERDLNFLIDAERGPCVFKIANALETKAMLECQHAVFDRLAAARVFPRVATALESVHGNRIETVAGADGGRHACRVLPWIEGRLLADVEIRSDEMLRDLGHHLALLDLALEGFTHPALERPLLWKMDTVLETLQRFAPKLADDDQRALVSHFAGVYRAEIEPRLDSLRRGVIHNDANSANVLLDAQARRVVSIIDFGDMVESWLVVEPAVAATYAMLERDDPLASAASVFRGYRREIPLRDVETELAFDFICMRLCMSVCINAHQRVLEPGNEYLNVDVEAAWELLRYLKEIEPAAAQALLFPDR